MDQNNQVNPQGYPQYQQAPQFQQAPQGQPQYQQAPQGQPQYYQQAPQGQPQYYQQAPQGQPQYQQAPQKPNPVAAGFKKFAQFLVASLKTPFTAASDFYDNASIAESAVILGIVGVAYVAIHFLVGLITGANYISEYMKLGEWASLLGYANLSIGTGVAMIVGGFFFPILYYVIMLGSVFGSYVLVNKLFIKKPLNIQKALAFCASCGIALLFLVACKAINMGFVRIPLGRYNFLTMAVNIVSKILSLFVFIICLMNLKKVITDIKQYLLTIAIGVAIFYVATYTFDWLFSFIDLAFFAFPL